MAGRVLLFIHRHFFATLAMLAGATLVLAVLRRTLFGAIGID